MTPGLWIALAAVVVALAVGGYRALTDGRFRRTPTPSVEPSLSVEPPLSVELVETTPETTPDTTWTHVSAATGESTPGERATLVQFSSAFCAPCRATRRTLADVAGIVPGVVHLEIDAEHHLDLVRRLAVLRTPTTLVLDAAGREVTRAAGAPRREQVLATLAGLDGPAPAAG